MEGEEDSPGSPKYDSSAQMREALITKLENIRVRNGVQDATKANPIDLKIEDIISLPMKNS